MYIVGIDEAGRGSLFGSVYACALIFPENLEHEYMKYMKDSKKLSSKKRKLMQSFIKEYCIDYEICSVSNEIIDEINILKATMQAMNTCISNLKSRHLIKDLKYLIDGNLYYPSIDNKNIQYECIVKGDSKFVSIMGASILAKVAHDDDINSIVSENDELNKYDLLNNMGYGTKKHRSALLSYGFTQYHRRSFCKFMPLSESEKTNDLES